MTEKDILERHLKKCGLKMTKQREFILAEFLANESHCSAEELYDQVRKKDPAIGQATIFRTLKVFVDAGLASAVELNGKTLRYEHRHNHGHHDHIICTVCGKVVEFTDTRIENLQAEISRQNGFILTSHRMELFGTCPDCVRSAGAKIGHACHE